MGKKKLKLITQTVSSLLWPKWCWSYQMLTYQSMSWPSVRRYMDGILLTRRNTCETINQSYRPTFSAITEKSSLLYQRETKSFFYSCQVFLCPTNFTMRKFSVLLLTICFPKCQRNSTNQNWHTSTWTPAKFVAHKLDKVLVWGIKLVKKQINIL